jgi:XTP/dITP diphosphohydrolase
MGAPFHVIEDGDTFEHNAILKARAACVATGYVAIADDSGLQVDALLGRPGVRSARYAHEHANDDENNVALLAALAEVKNADRAARFRCALAVVTPFGHDPLLAFGSCEGRIAKQLRGRGGFGYDPLFLVKNCDDRSMAELEPLEKNRVSHRGQAVNNLRPRLIELVASMVRQLDPAVAG